MSISNDNDDDGHISLKNCKTLQQIQLIFIANILKLIVTKKQFRIVLLNVLTIRDKRPTKADD